ncbi:MAG TPA: NADH:flavin oxidoreductase [Chloroflexaceae bacterium]|nr:NADH:flavin oxidoreductase [Chloroflexaceae bacterium]
MADLFSPLSIGGRELPNRIVMAPVASGAAGADGFVGDAAVDYYWRRARGGVGLLLSEALRVTPPADGAPAPHIGIYADAFVPGLRRLVAAARVEGARVLLTLDALDPPAPKARLGALREAFILAAWRAHCAGADGVMLTAADGGALAWLLSPLRNTRADGYGQGGDGRRRLALEIVEGVGQWLGRRLLVGFRLPADEFTPGGLTLQDARVLAKRLTAAGVGLLDVTAHAAPPGVARFPGWAVPLASSVRRVVDVPVVGSGELGDPHLADSVVRDGSVDLVMLDGALRRDPDWPLHARDLLNRTGGRAS